MTHIGLQRYVFYNLAYVGIRDGQAENIERRSIDNVLCKLPIVQIRII